MGISCDGRDGRKRAPDFSGSLAASEIAVPPAPTFHPSAHRLVAVTASSRRECSLPVRKSRSAFEVLTVSYARYCCRWVSRDGRVLVGRSRRFLPLVREDGHISQVAVLAFATYFHTSRTGCCINTQPAELIPFICINHLQCRTSD